jgi:DNA invertase Pin-like site-specific DNA recombinase
VSKIDLNPDNQIFELREYAKRQGYTVTGEYTDYISGIKEHRPQFDVLINDALQHKFDAILIWKLDRLGRSLQHLIKIVQYFEKLGIDLIVQTQNIDTTTSSGKLMFHIFGAIAEFERSLISERTKAGINRARTEGKRIGRAKGQKDKTKRKTEGYFKKAGVKWTDNANTL